MKRITEIEMLSNFHIIMNSVMKKGEKVAVYRQYNKAVVILRLADYESLKATTYLLKNPANAHKILTSINRLASGEGLIKDLVE